MACKVRSSDHLAWSQGLWAAGCVFFGERGIQSRIATHGTTFKARIKMEWRSEMKGN